LPEFRWASRWPGPWPVELNVNVETGLSTRRIPRTAFLRRSDGKLAELSLRDAVKKNRGASKRSRYGMQLPAQLRATHYATIPVYLGVDVNPGGA